jgi:hypothetical protein
MSRFLRLAAACRRILGCCLLLPLAVPAKLAAAPTAPQKVATHFPIDALQVPFPVRQHPQPTPWTVPEPAPIHFMQRLAREPGGALWLGSTNGAARFDPNATHRWDRWQYFFGPRWLKDNAVHNIWIDPAAPYLTVWIRTASAATRLEWTPMSLEEKARRFEERIENRHVRHGLVADSVLRVPGDTASNRTTDNDNDGLWTAMYCAAQAYRYAATREPDARTKARRALHALLRLEAITGVPGFYARSFVAMDEPRPHGGEWHPTPDGQWLWKGDTSSDESVGHYYAYALYYDLVADPAEQQAIRAVVARMTDYLMRHDYDLLDLDGQPTRWGRWSEAYFKTEEGAYEAPLRSLELLAFLKTTHHITGEPKYAAAYQDRIARGYARWMRDYRRWPGPGEINFSDDELAYLSYDPLLRYEKEPKLRAQYLDGLRFTWREIRSDMNPLWNYISVASGAGPMTRAVRDESRRTLERIPLDLITWRVQNSHRQDVRFQATKDRFDRLQLSQALPPDERPVSKWNGNPYIPDGGGAGGSEDDGAFFLLPYWMGRYHGWVR